MIAHDRHRKYAQARTYHARKNGEVVGIFPLEWKMSENELNKFFMEILDLTDADSIVLHWTALEGVVDRKVEI